DFRLIDPPRVSPLPVAPNRLILISLALLGALGAGLAASFLASQAWPTFFDATSLRQMTGLPVLGTVSLVVGEPQRRKERRGLIGFVSALLALLGSFGTGLTILFMHAVRAA
ncbi:MAG: chain length-determining protein, partial [Betaproteobacteria bacterium]